MVVRDKESIMQGLRVSINATVRVRRHQVAIR